MLTHPPKNQESVSLGICGDGPMRQAIEKFGTSHGFVKNLNRYIQNADIVFASSYLIILQALSYGKPVVSVYENDLKRDYLLDAPFSKWLVTGSNQKKLAQTIVHLPGHVHIPHSLPTWDDVAKSYEQL